MRANDVSKTVGQLANQGMHFAAVGITYALWSLLDFWRWRDERIEEVRRVLHLKE